MSLLFGTGRFAVHTLGRDAMPEVQALFDANPGFFERVGGQPPLPDEALREFDEDPPAHLGWTRRWFCGIRDAQGGLRGAIILVSDLGAPGVWHTALFFLEDSLHGTGAASEVQAALESFARASGARWLRLGVILGNVRAERFWARCGYREVRRRELSDATGRACTARVMIKALEGLSLSDYVRLVPRDMPGSALP